MNQYVSGAVIKELREKNALTQSELAAKLNVSDKTVSKKKTEINLCYMMIFLMLSGMKLKSATVFMKTK